VSTAGFWDGLYAAAQDGWDLGGAAPVLEDWLWHCVFPFIAYVTLLVAALRLQRDPPTCLLLIGATALLLLFIGIHNAWDAVTYIATQQPQHREGPPERK